MLRSPAFLVGLAAGAAVAWWAARRRGQQLVPFQPYSVKGITRRGRMGRSWPGSQGKGSYR